MTMDDSPSPGLPDIPDLASQPHDAFFKHVFSNPEIAVPYFQRHLPAEIRDRARWEDLRLVPSSFVKTDLQQAHSDLLFSVPILSDGEKERVLLLHLVFEHQTKVDPIMPLRMLIYQVEILQRYQREHGLPLPPVIGMVLHQGPDKWTVSPHLHDLFNLPEDIAPVLMPYLPGMKHALLDLSQIDPAQTEDSEHLKIVLKLMKLAREKELIEIFTWLVSIEAHLLENFPDALLSLSLLYALHADDTLDIQDISRTVESSKRISKITMNAVDKLIEQGKVEGETKGTWIGRIQLLQEFLSITVTPHSDLSSLSLDDLQIEYRVLQQRYDSDFKGKS
jgi:predicted transposase/invertase (TIGR01784 family)